MPRRAALVGAPFLLAWLVTSAQGPTGVAAAPGGASISADDLRRDVFALASDDMAGRLVATSGNRMAQEFIAARFADLGLRGVGHDGYQQRFDLVVTTLGTSNDFEWTRDGQTSTGALGVDFHPERYSGSASAEGPVVFVGFGISASSLGYSDYGEADLTGRVVVMLDHEPAEDDPTSPFDGAVASEHARGVRKALEAQRRGAVAVVFVPDVHNHGFPRSVEASLGATWPSQFGRIPPYQLGAWTAEVDIPVVRISVGVAEGLLTDPGEALAEMTRRAEGDSGFVPVERSGVRVRVTTTTDREVIPEHNIVGLLEGNDPTLQDEWVIVCAHLDHEGTTSAGIFNGADDDASGVAGMLEVAQAMVEATDSGQRPRRSVLFAAWNAEERGLLGAWAYTEDPLHPLEDTVAVVNLDMIGRHEEVPENGGGRFRGLEPQTAESNRNAVHLMGYSYSPDLRRSSEAANAEVGLELRFRYDENRSNLLRRSDHWPFLFRRVPALFVHTGLHPDYHTERDQPEKLDYEKMARIVRLVHQLTWDLAQADARPTLDY